MQKVKVATDSVSDIPVHLCEKYNISVLPITIIHEGKEYSDGIDFDALSFYRMLLSSDSIPLSSQINISAFNDLYNKTFAEGYGDLVQVCLNSKGSGTYNSAVLAKNIFYDSNPDAVGKFNITVIDSAAYSMIFGAAVVAGAVEAQNGADAEAVTEKIFKVLKTTRAYFVPANLRFAKKSGRISSVAAFAGDAMGIKPVLTMKDGEIIVCSKVRGEKKVLAEMAERYKTEAKKGSPYILIKGNNDVSSNDLRESFREEFGISPSLEFYIGCVVSMNIGPDIVGIIFFTE